MFRNIKKTLSDKLSGVEVTEGRQEFTPLEFMPAVMAQNNYVDSQQPLESDGLMQYIDIDCIKRGEPIAVRMQPDIPNNLDYLIVRIKCTPKQLKTSGLDFKIWLPR